MTIEQVAEIHNKRHEILIFSDRINHLAIYMNVVVDCGTAYFLKDTIKPIDEDYRIISTHNCFDDIHRAYNHVLAGIKLAKDRNKS